MGKVSFEQSLTFYFLVSSYGESLGSLISSESVSSLITKSERIGETSIMNAQSAVVLETECVPTKQNE